jgi:hypothetical protein
MTVRSAYNIRRSPSNMGRRLERGGRSLSSVGFIQDRRAVEGRRVPLLRR